MFDLPKQQQQQQGGISKPASSFQYMEIDLEDNSSHVRSGTVSRLFNGKELPHKAVMGGSFLLFAAVISALFFSSSSSVTSPVVEGAAWSAKAKPFSTTDPVNLGFAAMERPASSKPGPIFGELLNRSIPLPTNCWYQNFLLGSTNNGEKNKVFQVPYIMDTAGTIAGVRTHPAHVQGNDKSVMMTYEPDNGMSLGAVEEFLSQHRVRNRYNKDETFSKLAIELEWITKEEQFESDDKADFIDEDLSSKNSYQSSSETLGLPYMRSPIVRGSPYTSMIYNDATPRVFVQRMMNKEIVVDGVSSEEGGQSLLCSSEFGNFTSKPVTVKSDLKVQFDTSDMTWLIFVSEPTEFVCSTGSGVVDPNYVPPAPGVVGPAKPADQLPYFELRATKAMHRGMMRIALSNNCSAGQNPIYCGVDHIGVPRNMSSFESLLRQHKDLYPTAKADIEFTFPVASTESEELRVNFNWEPRSMQELATLQSEDGSDPAATSSSMAAGSTKTAAPVLGTPRLEVLMFALPHHQERVRSVIGSSNKIMYETQGCTPTIHGYACPILGRSWSLVEHLHPISFTAPREVRKEMLSAVKAAAVKDLSYQLPPNYMVGAGDTYFSGKMLAKLARVLIVTEEVQGVKDIETSTEFQQALSRLRGGVEVWLNGSAQSPFLYDRSWGGMIMCGCNYVYEDGVGRCANKLPDCPALSDQGQNFGAGFYNDHHYHFGYHIYAAAVLCKYDHKWARKYYDHVLMLVRDIANPSDSDPYFPTFRHKDWFLGFSWASGVVTIEGEAYPNGRNQESVSEAIAAYEAVALFGDVLAGVFKAASTTTTSTPPNKFGSSSSSSSPSSSSSSTTTTSTSSSSSSGVSKAIIPNHNHDEDDDDDAVPVLTADEEASLHDSAVFIRDMGRLLMCTEIRAARTYWQVQAPETPGVSRIYPDVYAPKIVGMIWSMLVQEQTWFGNEEWKSYGIQMIPLTAASELRDNSVWVEEMLPSYVATCNATDTCGEQGFGIAIYALQATVGKWEEAWDGVSQLDDSVWSSAGGNGHSLSNTLWYIATRPEPGTKTF